MEAAKIDAVISRIEAGESERSACAAEGIARNTFRSAALRHGAADHYARALEALANDQVEKLEQTIDDMRAGTIDAAMARVEIDARKWFASKFLPKRYGEAQLLKHADADGNALPPAIEIRLIAAPSRQIEDKRET